MPHSHTEQIVCWYPGICSRRCLWFLQRRRSVCVWSMQGSWPSWPPLRTAFSCACRVLPPSSRCGCAHLQPYKLCQSEPECDAGGWLPGRMPSITFWAMAKRDVFLLRRHMRWCAMRSRWRRCGVHSQGCSRTWWSAAAARPSRAEPSCPTCPRWLPCWAAGEKDTGLFDLCVDALQMITQ